MRAAEVFTPGKLPEVTYVDDHLQENSKLLRNALEAGAAVVSLSGPSKSGKTVFIEKSIGKGNLLQVTGAGIDTPAKLWERVFDLIGTPIAKRVSTTSDFKGTVNGKAGAELGLVLNAKAEVGASGTWSHGEAQHDELSYDYLQLLIRELGDSDLVIFIDDFHYIPRDIQVVISQQIKEAIRHNVKFVCASVPYHSDDAIRANPDLRGRAIKLDFDYWTPDELRKIAIRGFEALNLEASPAYLDAMAKEAAGSPQLMQTLCLTTCFESNTYEKEPELKKIESNAAAIKKVCSQTALTADYSSTVDKMKDGPRTRGQNRNAYALKSGAVSDVYPLVLSAIALDPPELNIRYPNLQRRVQSLCSGDMPSGSSVTGACSQIASIANDSENRSVLEWDGENDVLDIRDPYLLFYLRWANPSSGR